MHSFCTDNSLKKHERLRNNHHYCRVKMPTEDNNRLKYNHGEKSLKSPFKMIADLECLLIKEQPCQSSAEKSYTDRKAEHEPSSYSLSLICSFDATKARHYFYRGRDCLENFWNILKELETEIINYEEEEMIPLTDDEKKSYEKQK